MHLHAEAAGAGELVNMSGGFIEEAGITPGLWWTSSHEGATQTLRPVAGAVLKLPEYVHRANQPMFMSGVELDGWAVFGCEGHHVRTQERNVVKMDYII
jgi:hypothetical protein